MIETRQSEMPGSAVLAIDGTGSREWRRKDGENSHVMRFVHEYRGLREFVDDQTHGPGTFGGDVEAIYSTVCRLADHCVAKHGVTKFDVVGHSRGGHIAIRVCQHLLKYRNAGVVVRFLGLFDAVDRSPDETLPWGNAPGTGAIPHNVKVCRHAMRSKWTGNRAWFGNTGTRWTPEHTDYVSKVFWASHGAVGGDPASSWSFGDGNSWASPITGGMTLLTPPFIDHQRSDEVWHWMRDEAIAHGVPLGVRGDCSHGESVVAHRE